MTVPFRRYTELKHLKTFKERFDYLRLGGIVGESTFGYDRYINQLLYTSARWKKTRGQVIIRDNGNDLGIDGYDLKCKIIVHHMNPLTLKDIEEVSDDIFNPEYLICVSQTTHNAIHFGDETLLPQLPIERRAGDTCPWK